MLRASQFFVVSLVLSCIGIILAILHFNSPVQPSLNQWRDTVSRTAANLMPLGAKNCGAIGLQDDPSVARSCVSTSVQSGISFGVLSQAQGEDSEVWQLIVRTSDGKTRGFTFDSFGWEHRGIPSFTTREIPCHAIGHRNKEIESGIGQVKPAIFCSDS
jgi:hypothetical protein